MFAGVVQIQIHLSGVGVGELSNLQINDDQTAKPAMKKQQVDAVPLVADAQPPLPGNEGEVASEFQKKVFQPVDQRFFQSVFGIFILQSQELEDQRVLDLLFGRQLLGRLKRVTPAENGRLVA